MNEWIDWTKQIKAIAQIGLTYTQDKYDLQRYHQLTQIAHEMIAKLADVPKVKVDHFFIPDSGYATPKVDLRAGIIKDKQVLLVKERSDSRWALPGGWADVNESPSCGIIREVKEESGFDVKVNRLIAIKDRSLHPYSPQYPNHIYKMLFLCELISGQPEKNIEIEEIDFFSLTKLPPLSISRILEDDIRMVFEYHQNPDKPVQCD
jgi:ADP-ribose pyrophosphatase YjhB (NUDIX family)